jgi:hypothetical protein
LEEAKRKESRGDDDWYTHHLDLNYGLVNEFMLSMWKLSFGIEVV